MMEYYFYAAVFVLGILTMYLFTRFYNRRLLRDELRYYRKELKKKKMTWPPELFPLLHMLKRHKDRYKKEASLREKELEDLTWRMEEQTARSGELEQKVATLTRENKELKAIVEGPDSGGVYRDKGSRVVNQAPRGRTFSTPVVPAAEPEPEILYFGIPDKHGNFPADRGELQYDSRKLFKIVFSLGSDRGELHYISGELDMKAINNVDYYLLPVCEISNMEGRGTATRVIQEEKGEVRLTSGRWSMTTRVRVKLL